MCGYDTFDMNHILCLSGSVCASCMVDVSAKDCPDSVMLVNFRCLLLVCFVGHSAEMMLEDIYPRILICKHLPERVFSSSFNSSTK